MANDLKLILTGKSSDRQNTTYGHSRNTGSTTNVRALQLPEGTTNNSCTCISFIPLPQEQAITTKNEQATQQIDQVVELWNSMWIAEFNHNQAIADNVKEMQGRCRQILNALCDGIEQLMQLASDPKHTTKLGAAAPSRYASFGSMDAVCIPDFRSAQFRCRTVC